MKVSEITLEDIKQHLRLDHTEDDIYLMTLLYVAKSYVKNYTGLDDTKINLIDELSSAVLMIICDLYENRSTTIEKGTLNKIYDSILSMHSCNFL